jgi:phosphoribosylformylglycinamidine synthase
MRARTSHASAPSRSGLTNCLNFGNPEKPHIAVAASPRGAPASGCLPRARTCAVVGGNVSLYNEGGGGPIYPTPVVGVVGELPDAARVASSGFAQDGDAVAVVTAASWVPSLVGSELAKLRGEAPVGALPEARVDEVRAVQDRVREAVRSGGIRTAHDVADGGLAIAIAEACVLSGRGARITLGASDEAALFGEAPAARSCSRATSPSSPTSAPSWGTWAATR